MNNDSAIACDNPSVLDALFHLEATVANQSLPWETAVFQLVQLAQGALGCDRVHVWWGEDLNAVLHPLADTDLGAPRRPSGLPVARLGELWQRGYWAIDDYQNAELKDPWAIALSAMVSGRTGTVYLLPLQALGEGKGLLCCERWQVRPWSELDLWRGCTLGQSLLAMYDRQRYQQLQQRFTQGLKTLHQYQAELHQTTQAWQESQHFIQSIVHASPCIVYVYDRREDRVIYANRQLSEQLGYTDDDLQQLVGPFLSQITHAEDLPQVQRQRQQAWGMAPGRSLQMECRVMSKHGGWRWLLIREAPLLSPTDGQGKQVIGTAMDITQLKATEVALRTSNSQLHRLAITDELTQLANRRRLDQRLQQVWLRMAQMSAPISLLLCDIDHFKGYNDALGHPAGDRCLKQVAQVIFAATRPEAEVARYGGEEFAVLLPRMDQTTAQGMARRIQDHLRHHAIPHPTSPISACVTLSLGIATVVPKVTESPQRLVVAADQALYEAKVQGRDRFQQATLVLADTSERP